MRDAAAKFVVDRRFIRVSQVHEAMILDLQVLWTIIVRNCGLQWMLDFPLCPHWHALWCAADELEFSTAFRLLSYIQVLNHVFQLSTGERWLCPQEGKWYKFNRFIPAPNSKCFITHGPWGYES